MELEAARRYYAKELSDLADQHRYVALGQREVAARMAIIPTQAAEVAWAKGCLDSAEGKPVDWKKLKRDLKQAREDTELALREIRGY